MPRYKSVGGKWQGEEDPEAAASAAQAKAQQEAKGSGEVPDKGIPVLAEALAEPTPVVVKKRKPGRPKKGSR